MSKSTLSTANYDDSLNPFASDEEDQESEKNVDAQTPQRKVIHANPFEVSDDEAEAEQPAAAPETSIRKKITPDPECSITLEAKKPKDKQLPLLPKASPKIHKKKHAPAPPGGVSPANHRKMLLEDPSSSPKISQKASSIQGVNESTPDQNNQDDDEEKTTSDVHMRKSKPAPPRPMPPKRRVSFIT